MQTKHTIAVLAAITLLSLLLVAPASAAITPVASFTKDSAYGALNASTTSTFVFTDNSTNTPTSWNWSFGDGTYSTSQNTTHAYSSAGTYSVTLNATNAGGSNVSTSQTVTVDLFNKYASHYINGSSAGMQTNYQMKFTVWNTSGTSSGENLYVCSGNTQTDWDDVRFTTANGTVMDHWIESTNATAAIMRVEVPSIANGTTTQTTVKVFYGNATATSWSNGDNTFAFFDHFDGVSLNTTKWTVVGSGGSISISGSVMDISSPSTSWERIVANYGANIPFSATSKTYVSTESNGGGNEFYFGMQDTDSSDYTLFADTWPDGKKYWTAASGTRTMTTRTSSFTGSYYLLKTVVYSGHNIFYENENQVADVTTNVPVHTPGYYRFDVAQQHVYSDYVYVCKYASPEPLHSTWSVELCTSVPIANFTKDSAYGALNASTTSTFVFTDTSTNTPTSWNWSFGDGTYSTSQNTTHAYSSAGTYSVALTATNAGGSNVSTSQTVTVDLFNKYASHYINGSSAGAQTNYQMKFTLWNTSGTSIGENLYVCSGNTQTDWDDVRFTTANGTVMDHWIESTNATAAIMWVEVPSIANGTTTQTTVKVFYGNATATSWSNGDNTFAFFDHFDNPTNSLNTTKWTVTASGGSASVSGSVLDVTSGVPWERIVANYGANIPFSATSRTYVSTESGGGGAEFIFGMRDSDSSDWIAFSDTWPIGKKYRNAASGTSTDTARTSSYTGSYYILKSVAYSGHSVYYENGVQVADSTTNVPVHTPEYYMFETCQQHVYSDYVYVCKYASSEPLHSTWAYDSCITAPVANFTSNVTSGTSPLSVQFNDTSTNSPTSWNWTFGAANYSSSQNPVYTFTGAANYTVTLNATNSAGSNLTVRYINVSAGVSAPVSSFTKDSAYGALNASTTSTFVFTDTSTNTPTSWNWSFGDGTYSTSQNTTHAYSSAGTYAVTLNATNAGGSNVSTSQTVTVDLFNKYASHYINGSSSGAQTNYQMKFTVWNTSGTSSGENLYVCSGNTQTDWDDVRFTTANGTVMDHWIESTNATAAIMWVEVPSIANGTTTQTTVKVFYGNATATSWSNITNTMIFGDDFSGSSLDTSKWGCGAIGGGSATLSGGNITLTSYNLWAGPASTPQILEIYGSFPRVLASGKFCYWGFINPVVGDTYSRWHTDHHYTDHYEALSYDGGWDQTDLGTSYTGTHRWTTVWNYNTNAKFYIDNVLVATHTHEATSDQIYGCYYSDTGSVVMDWFFIRKYASSEPTHSTWTTESCVSAPVANFTSNTTSGYPPFTVSFTDNSTNTPTSWQWMFNGSVTNTTQNASWTYNDVIANAITWFAVNHSATNEMGTGWSNQTNYITVYPLNASFTANVTEGINPLLVGFTDATGNGTATAWNWSFGDGYYSDEQNPSHTYNTPGLFNVSLNASNAYSFDWYNVTNMINVTASPVPDASFTSNVTSGYPNFSVQFTDTSTSTPTEWYWDFGDGDTSTEQNPIHAYDTNIGTSIVTYNVSLNASNTGGYDWSNQTGYITLYPLNASFSSNVTSGKTTLAVQFTDLTNNGTPTSWEWHFGDGDTSTDQNPVHSFAYPGRYEIKLNASNLYSYDWITGYYIEVCADPTVDFSANTTSTCENGAIQFNSTTPLQLKIDFNNGVGLNEDPEFRIGWIVSAKNGPPFPQGRATDINITSGTWGGYDATGYFNITEVVSGWAVGARFLDSAPIVLHGGDITGVTDVSDYTYNWSFGDNTYSETKNPLHSYATSGVYTVNLTVTDSCGETVVSKTGYITVDASSTADFTSNITSGIVPLVVEFTQDSENATSYEWLFGDGGSDTGASVVHTFDDAIGSSITKYDVNMKANGDCGYSWENKTDYITVYPLNASFSADTTYGSNPLEVHFTDLTGNGTPTTWDWDWGDSTAHGNTQNPTHTYTTEGVYTVRLNVSNAYTFDWENKTTYIVVGDLPVSNFVANNTIGAVPLTVQFTDTSIGGIGTSWKWDVNNDGVTDYTTQNCAHTYNSAGTYTVNHTVTNEFGSDSEVKVGYITAGDIPSAGFTADTTLGYLPLTVHFTDTSTGATAWYWDVNNDGVVDYNTRNCTNIYTTAGTYTVNLTVTNAYGTDSEIKNAYITANGITANFTVDDISGAAPLTVQFTDLSVGTPDHWSWDFTNDGVNDSASQNPSHIYTVAGVYTVKLYAWNSYSGDSETKVDYIVVGNMPVAAFSGTPLTGDLPLTVTFTDSSTNATSWAWDTNNDGAVDNVTRNCSRTYSVAGKYTVKLTATNEYGSDTETKTDYVVTGVPNADFYTDQQWSTTEPLTCSFNDVSTGNPTEWAWEFGDGSPVSNEENPTHTYSRDGTYTVVLHASNAAGTDTETKVSYVSVGDLRPISPYDRTVVTPRPTTTFGVHATELVAANFNLSEYASIVPSAYTDMLPNEMKPLLWGVVFLFIFAALFLRYQEIPLLVFFGITVAATFMAMVPWEFAQIGQGLLIAGLATIFYMLIKGRFR